MVEGPDSNFSISPYSGSNAPKPSKVIPNSPTPLPESKTFKIPGMDFNPSLTEVQYKKFWAQMMSFLVNQVKQDEARMKKAFDRMKKSFEGRD